MILLLSAFHVIQSEVPWMSGVSCFAPIPWDGFDCQFLHLRVYCCYLMNEFDRKFNLLLPRTLPFKHKSWKESSVDWQRRDTFFRSQNTSCCHPRAQNNQEIYRTFVAAWFGQNSKRPREQSPSNSLCLLLTNRVEREICCERFDQIKKMIFPKRSKFLQDILRSGRSDNQIKVESHSYFSSLKNAAVHKTVKTLFEVSFWKHLKNSMKSYFIFSF